NVRGLTPARVGTFMCDEGRAGAAAVAIVSDDFWRDTLNARPDVLGSTVVVDGTPRTIIGLMPQAFRHPDRASLWLPLVVRPDDSATINNHDLYGVVLL